MVVSCLLQYYLCSVFHKRMLHITYVISVFYLPNDMNVVAHDNETIDNNTFIGYQKLKTANDDILELIRL